MTRKLRQLIVDSPNSLGGRARMRRWEMFKKEFPGAENLRILDLGGTVETWRRSPVRPRHVTVLNLYEPGTSDDEAVVPITGDACMATEILARAGMDTKYDLVFSNSLIEHVGGHAQRVQLADQVRLLAPRHWVQTPYRYFPVEPHWLFPGMQFLPVAARVKIAMRWPLVPTKHEDVESARKHVLWTELLSVTEMRDYFPTSTIIHEHIFGMTKSLIAIV